MILSYDAANYRVCIVKDKFKNSGQPLFLIAQVTKVGDTNQLNSQ
jgi:hypothetical protein